LNEFYISNASGKIGLHWCTDGEVTQEVFPADAIRILERAIVGHLGPMIAVVYAEIGCDTEMRGSRCLSIGLYPTAVQTGDGRSVRTINLEREQVVAPYPRRPGTMDCAGRAARQLDQRRRGVLDIDRIA